MTTSSSPCPRQWYRRLFPTEAECEALSAAVAAAEAHLVGATVAFDTLAEHHPHPAEVALLIRDLRRLRRQVGDIAEEVAP